MKIDTTSEHHILSRKIRVGINPIFFALVLHLMLIWPTYTWAEFNILADPKFLNSIPQSELVIVDTRSKFKYLLGHIPNAVHLGSWEDFTHKVDGVRGMLIKNRHLITSKLKPHGIDYNKTIVVYGDAKDPWRTDGRFFWMFEKFGFKKISVLEGGLDNWLNYGGELAVGPGHSPKSSALTPENIIFNPIVGADQKWIYKRLGSKNIAIIDNRTRDEYDGDRPYGSSRGGHIPTAFHIYWPDFFSTQGYVKPRNELLSLLQQYQINLDKEIIVYCTGGVRSAMAYFVFRHLGYKVRNYDGSWWDWSNNPKLPIETS